MPLSSYPLIAWGAADAINGVGYSTVGAIGQTAGQIDPLGGTDAYLLDDNDAASHAARVKQVTNLAASGLVIVGIRKGTGFPMVLLHDATLTANRVGVYASAWGAGAPTLTSFAGSPILLPIDLGGGWYALLLPYSGVVPGNDNRLYLYPDYNNGTVTGAGTSYFWVRNVALLDLLDEATSWEDPRDESEFDQAQSGVEDSYVVGWDQMLEGRIRFVPNAPRADPGPVSGWYGANESAGINCGIRAMLRAGRRKLPLIWARDRSNCPDNQTGYLNAPLKGKPDFERNGERQFVFQLRGASEFIGV